jgi:hypothetical protein
VVTPVEGRGEGAVSNGQVRGAFMGNIALSGKLYTIIIWAFGKFI